MRDIATASLTGDEVGDRRSWILDSAETKKFPRFVTTVQNGVKWADEAIRRRPVGGVLDRIDRIIQD
jgi:hypothetical protein